MAKQLMGKMPVLIANKVIVKEKKIKDVLIQKGFGDKKEGELILDLLEAAYLMEKDKLDVTQDAKKVTQEQLNELASKKDKNFYNKLIVYKDLRERGFVVKTGFKFGFDLRVYPRGKKPGEEHTQWVIKVATQDEKTSMIEYSRMVRLSGNIKTTLLIAVVDGENDVNYYETKRITP